jgi:hypothetical protein
MKVEELFILTDVKISTWKSKKYIKIRQHDFKDG